MSYVVPPLLLGRISKCGYLLQIGIPNNRNQRQKAGFESLWRLLTISGKFRRVPEISFCIGGTTWAMWPLLCYWDLVGWNIWWVVTMKKYFEITNRILVSRWQRLCLWPRRLKSDSSNVGFHIFTTWPWSHVRKVLSSLILPTVPSTVVFLGVPLVSSYGNTVPIRSDCYWTSGKNSSVITRQS